MAFKKSPQADLLFKAFMSLENLDECYSFFEDLISVKEFEAFVQRIQVAQLLAEKKVYSEISDLTGASTATISRVSRSFNYGNGAYQRVLERIK